MEAAFSPAAARPLTLVLVPVAVWTSVMAADMRVCAVASRARCWGRGWPSTVCTHVRV